MNEESTMDIPHEVKFVRYLESFVSSENRAVLSSLRRGLGKESWKATEMFPVITSWTAKLSAHQERNYFLLASLVGLYPTRSWQPKDEDRFNNFGRSVSFLKDESGSVERRFVALLNADEEDLPNHLRSIVSLLKSKDVPVNWVQLLIDLRNWGADSRTVQRNWARGFWGDHKSKNTNPGEK